MGGSDVTCGVSHLPIQSDDPTRFVFLRQDVWGSESKWEHAWAKWVPIGLPVKGAYDFYGRVEGVEHTRVVKFVTEAIGRHAVPLDEEKLSGYRDLEDFPNSIESLMCACERGWLELELPGPEHDEDSATRRVRVSPFYVSEPMYQAAVENLEEGGLSTWRGRLRAHGNLEAKPLRDAVEWYATKEQRQERMRRALAAIGDSDATIEAMLKAAYPLTLRAFTTGFDSTPDVLVCGRDWKPDVGPLHSLRAFGDDDWEEFDRQHFDFQVFFRTFRHNLRREFYPTLCHMQYHFPDDELLSHRALARKVEERCLEIGETYRRDQQHEGQETDP